MHLRPIVCAFLSLSVIVTAGTALGGGPLSDPIPEPIEKDGPPIKLETVVTGLTAPNWGVPSPADPNRLFVTDQNGILWAIDLVNDAKAVFFDVSARLVSLGIAGPGSFDERGLLGVAFHPGYAANGLLYTYTSEPLDGTADFSTMPPGIAANHQSVIAEWQVPNPTNPSSVVDPASRRELLRIDQPQFNHDGGAINFGPDGMLYIALGDGGNANDIGDGHGTIGNGQDPSNILGSIVRIDPDGSNSANGQYGIPSDNPFVGVAGFLDEIYAYGLRNPFRFSFDSVSGRLYLADVGQNHIEEVDVISAGGNYGWRTKEGSFCFDPAGFVTDDPVCGPPDLVDPIAEYDHDEGRAIIGGFVYRGRRLPSFYGRYIFGDWAQNFASDGRLFFLKKKVSPNEQVQKSGIAEMNLPNGLGMFVLGFGQDAMGELYVLANLTGIPFGSTGAVLRITPGNGRSKVRAGIAGAGALGDANPNPFNPVTRISYTLSHEGFTTLSVFDVRGRLVDRLVAGVQQAGDYTVEWDASTMASGIYFYRLDVGSFNRTKKMVLIK